MSLSEIIFSSVLSFALTFSLMPIFIGYFIQKKYGQEIRDEGPKWHNEKAGTPTMGGVVFLLAAIISSLVIAVMFKQITLNLILMLVFVACFGSIGFLDDFLKIFKKQNEGLTSKQKFLAQVLVALLFFGIYWYQKFPLEVNLYFFDLKLSYLYIIFVIFWLVGFSNAVNLTDGLDGLVTGLSIISFGTYAIIAYKQKQFDVLLVCMTVVGGLIGFFPYNKKKAKIFMGDVGSLALGGLLACVSILLQQEWSLLLIGFVYILETLSVIIQVAYFKKTGKRIFKMSPIHHHFEMIGWSEWKVDIVFWTIGLIMSSITLFILR